jgi:hypothetical protein
MFLEVNIQIINLYRPINNTDINLLTLLNCQVFFPGGLLELRLPSFVEEKGSVTEQSDHENEGRKPKTGNMNKNGIDNNSNHTVDGKKIPPPGF